MTATVPPASGTKTPDRERTDTRHRKVAIIGSGPAGLTAALYAARANLEPLVVAGNVPLGQLMITSDVENYPGFPQGIQGPELMQLFREQAERFGSTLIDKDATKVDFSGRPFGIWIGQDEYRADAVIVATGASALWLGLPSEEAFRGRGVSACATCDGFFFRDREIAVVGERHGARAASSGRSPSKITMLGRRTRSVAARSAGRALATRRSTPWTRGDLGGREHRPGLGLRDTATAQVDPLRPRGCSSHRLQATPTFSRQLELDERGYLKVWTRRSGIEGVSPVRRHDHRCPQAVTAAGYGCRPRSTRALARVGGEITAVTAPNW